MCLFYQKYLFLLDNFTMFIVNCKTKFFNLYVIKVTENNLKIFFELHQTCDILSIGNTENLN